MVADDRMGLVLSLVVEYPHLQSGQGTNPVSKTYIFISIIFCFIYHREGAKVRYYLVRSWGTFWKVIYLYISFHSICRDDRSITEGYDSGRWCWWQEQQNHHFWRQKCQQNGAGENILTEDIIITCVGDSDSSIVVGDKEVLGYVWQELWWMWQGQQTHWKWYKGQFT